MKYKSRQWLLRSLYELEKENEHRIKLYDAKKQMYTELLKTAE